MDKKQINIGGYLFTPQRLSTRAGSSMVSHYQFSRISRLDQAYASPSDSKEYAYDYCKRMCKALGGQNQKIPSHNGWAFSFAFEIHYEGMLVLIYITKDYQYIIF